MLLPLPQVQGATGTSQEHPLHRRREQNRPCVGRMRLSPIPSRPSQTCMTLLCMCSCLWMLTVDRKATTKSFNFATKRNLDFYYVSAADGTNVVKVFNEAIRKGLECKEKPPDDFFVSRVE